MKKIMLSILCLIALSACQKEEIVEVEYPIYCVGTTNELGEDTSYTYIEFINDHELIFGNTNLCGFFEATYTNDGTYTYQDSGRTGTLEVIDNFKLKDHAPETLQLGGQHILSYTCEVAHPLN